MRILPSTFIAEALSILRSGGSVIHATETCYGIACDLSNPTAVQRLFEIKRRPFGQPVSALFASLEQARQYLEFSPVADRLAKAYLPGPLTIVLLPLPAAPVLRVTHRSPLTAHRSPIGLRFSPHPVALALVRAFGSPIATTSANLHGQPNPYSIADIQSQFLGSDSEPDLILDSGTLPTTPPSTVVEVIGEELRILRQGSLNISSV